MTDTVLYISQATQLKDLTERLHGSPWLAVDTEFMREKTYYPKLCLLQIANPDLIACIDPLQIHDLQPLKALFCDPGVPKVFHAGRQDLEILLQEFDTLPTPLYDTQIAATLLGFSDQIGYGALVERAQGVKLEKAHTRADWSRRPLSDEQIQYAADDVRYLGAIYLQQTRQLARLDRLHWLDKDFDLLADEKSYRPDLNQIWRRIKESRRLRGRSLAVLQGLAAWREQLAMRRDLPRRWVLGDETLVDLARQMPTNHQQLTSIRGIAKGRIKASEQDILNTIEKCRSKPKQQWPQLETVVELSSQQVVLADLLMLVGRIRAQQFGIGLPMLINRKQVERIVQDPKGWQDVLSGWRGALLNDDIEAMFSNRLKLILDRQEVQIQTSTSH